MFSLTAGGRIRTGTSIRTCDGAGRNPPHKQAQAYPEHLKKIVLIWNL